MLFLVVYDRKITSIASFKKRYNRLNTYPTLRFGSIGIATKNTMRFEFTYLLFFRKFIKKFLRTKKIFYNDRKVWMFLRPNHVISKKGKNSRMGKGKGAFIRWCSVLYGGSILIELYGFQYKHAQKFSKKLEKRLKVPLLVLLNKNAQSKEMSATLLGCKPTLLTFVDFFSKA